MVGVSGLQDISLLQLSICCCKHLIVCNLPPLRAKSADMHFRLSLSGQDRGFLVLLLRFLADPEGDCMIREQSRNIFVLQKSSAASTPLPCSLKSKANTGSYIILRLPYAYVDFSHLGDPQAAGEHGRSWPKPHQV